MKRTIRMVLPLGCLFLLPWAANAQNSSKAEKPEIKKSTIGKNVFLEIEGDKRRVIIEAEVCKCEGLLEHLLTRQPGKTHEAILAADVDARHIHAALIAARAVQGSVVKFDPRKGVTPPTGTKIKITLRYEAKGKAVTVSAKDWLKVAKDRKVPEFDWVFAGSKFVPNTLNPKEPPFYLANDGDVICVSNFESALLDINIPSSADNSELNFEANTDKIPKMGTKVTVILEPVIEEKKDK